MKKRNIGNRILILLRKWGMVCKRKRQYQPKVKISHTIYPEGRTDISSIEIARNVYIQNKISTRKGCTFNSTTEDCICGANIDQFLEKCNK